MSDDLWKERALKVEITRTSFLLGFGLVDGEVIFDKPFETHVHTFPVGWAGLMPRTAAIFLLQQKQAKAI